MEDMKYRLYKMMSNTGLEFLKKLGLDDALGEHARGLLR